MSFRVDQGVVLDGAQYSAQPYEDDRYNGVVGGKTKRFFDVVVALIATIVLAPVIVFIALWIAIFDGAPVIYRHTRVGHNGRPFPCFKFRSMVVDGDLVLARHLRQNPSARAEWDATRKLTHDPRITPIGRILRKTSLDELPQLLNVLRGEMSLVGPRPIVSEEMVRYGGNIGYYLSARPGVTGEWQVSGRSDTSYESRVQLDRFYVTRWSILRDLYIIVATIPAVILQRGSR